MALVTSIEPFSKDRQAVHQSTKCTATTFTDGGARYLQLDTYGRTERQHPEKVSQSIQFDEAGASQLLKLIRETFPNLA